MKLSEVDHRTMFEHVVSNKYCQQEIIELHTAYLVAKKRIEYLSNVVKVAEEIRNSILFSDRGLHTNLEYSLDEKLRELGRFYDENIVTS